MFLRQGTCIFLATALILGSRGVWPESPDTGSATALSAAQIVERMQSRNQTRTEELKRYQALRHYQVEYKGFSATIAAKMDVEVNFDASSGKSFRIVSESGSKILCENVLKRAVDSEKEASQDKGSTALTAANYRVHLVGSESLG